MTNTLQERPFFVLLLAQGLALLPVGLFAYMAGVGGLSVPFWGLVLAQGGMAAGLSMLMGLSVGWAVFQLSLPFLLWAGVSFELPSWIFLLAFVVVFLVFRNASSERVPLYLSNATTWAAVNDLIGANKPAGRFLDIGSGLGGMVFYTARLRPGWQVQGVENAPLVWGLSKLRSKLSGQQNVEVLYGDMWDVDLSAYDAVYAFLSPAPMARLLKKVRAEMKPGSLFVSNSFWADDDMPDEQIMLSDRRHTVLKIMRL